jgi:hypothetical protein
MYYLALIIVAALFEFISFPALCQNEPSDPGNFEEPVLPQTFMTLSTQRLKGTNTVIYYKNSLIQPAHDKDQGWHDLKDEIENVANSAYPFDIRLSSSAHNLYAIICDSGPSADPECSLYSGALSKDTQPKLKILGIAFVIPGDGCLYVAGHADTMYDTRRKFCENDGKLQEVRQPFLYVGMKSEALHDIDMYSNRALKQKSGVIREGAFVEVLVDDHDVYLVRDEFGITGWLKTKEFGQCPGGNEIVGLCFAGD